MTEAQIDRIERILSTAAMVGASSETVSRMRDALCRGIAPTISPQAAQTLTRLQPTASDILYVFAFVVPSVDEQVLLSAVRARTDVCVKCAAALIDEADACLHGAHAPHAAETTTHVQPPPPSRRRPTVPSGARGPPRLTHANTTDAPTLSAGSSSSSAAHKPRALCRPVKNPLATANRNVVVPGTSTDAHVLVRAPSVRTPHIKVAGCGDLTRRAIWSRLRAVGFEVTAYESRDALSALVDYCRESHTRFASVDALNAWLNSGVTTGVISDFHDWMRNFFVFHLVPLIDDDRRAARSPR